MGNIICSLNYCIWGRLGSLKVQLTSGCPYSLEERNTEISVWELEMEPYSGVLWLLVLIFLSHWTSHPTPAVPAGSSLCAHPDWIHIWESEIQIPSKCWSPSVGLHAITWILFNSKIIPFKQHSHWFCLTQESPFAFAFWKNKVFVPCR